MKKIIANGISVAKQSTSEFKQNDTDPAQQTGYINKTSFVNSKIACYIDGKVRSHNANYYLKLCRQYLISLCKGHFAHLKTKLVCSITTYKDS